MQRSVFVTHEDQTTCGAVERMVALGIANLTGPLLYDGTSDLPPGAVLVVSSATQELPARAVRGMDVTTIALVADHAAGCRAMRDGADHYLPDTDVGGPALEAVMIAVDRAYRARNPVFSAAHYDNLRCVGGESFRWLIRHSAAVVNRRKEIGYLILVKLEPDTPIPPEILAGPACGRICETTRTADIVSWLGEEWFGILVATGLSLEGAHGLIHRLDQAFGRPLDVEGAAVGVRYNLGLTTYGNEGETSAAVLGRAISAVEQSEWAGGRYDEEKAE